MKNVKENAKIENEKIESRNSENDTFLRTLSELKNYQSVSRNSKTGSYNYSKIWDNFNKVVQIIPSLHTLSEDEVKYITAIKSRFVEAKTSKKLHTIESKVKGKIRSYVQFLNLQIEANYQDKPDSKNAKIVLDLISPFIF